VNVSLRASRETLNRVEADDIVASVDLAGLGSGQYSLTVQVHADSSPEAGVTRIEPPSVQVRISSGKQ
jgi:YbbR domain-containing protein